MKRKLLTAAIALGITFNCALATEVAFVDVAKVVDSSAQVQALKKEQQAKAKDIVSFVEKARKEVAATTDKTKKQTLEEKYNKELQAKKQKMDKEYAEKLQKIEASISGIVNEQAKQKGYDMVLSKGIVLYGSADITQDVIKAVQAADKASAKKK